MEKYPEHRKRELLLSDRIAQNSVKYAIESIFDINEDDQQKEEVYKNWERTPIKLYINSFGGSVYDGLALIDVIKRSKTPVHTICIGSCMSMGLWIWLAGSKRFIGKYSTYIWLTHTFFAYYYFQNYLYFFKYSTIIFAVCIICTIIVGFILEAIIKFITNVIVSKKFFHNRTGV